MPEQTKIEYALRFYSKVYLKSTFPLVPLKHFFDLCKKKARLDLRDQYSFTNLLNHLTKSAHANIMTLPKERR